MNIIHGHYRNESGLLQLGKLIVEKVGNEFVQADTGFRLNASTFTVAENIIGVEVTSPDSLIEFEPDDGELERIGMPILA